MVFHLYLLCLCASSSVLRSSCGVALIELSRAQRRGDFSFLFLPCQPLQEKCFSSQHIPLPHICVHTYSDLNHFRRISLRLVKIFWNFNHFSWEIPKSFMRCNFPIPVVHSVLHFTVFKYKVLLLCMNSNLLLIVVQDILCTSRMFYTRLAWQMSQMLFQSMVCRIGWAV